MGILRVILALCVYFIHTGWLGGFVIFPFSDRLKPVYSFFIISGFYMAFILNKKYIGNRSSYLLFISNRFLRIYPIYWFVMLAIIVFSALMLWRGVDTGDISAYLRSYAPLLHGHVLMLPFTIAKDLIYPVTLIFRCDYFTPCDIGVKGVYNLRMAWSLTYELLFYLIAPFLLRGKGFARLGVIAGVFLLWFIVFHFRLLNLYSPGYEFFHVLKLFMLGYISFILYDKISLKKVPLFALIGICILFVVFILTYDHIPLPNLRYKWLQFNEYFYYLSVTAALPLLFEFSGRFRVDDFIAKLSYPIYISHLFTNDVLTYTHIAKPNTQSFTIIGLVSVLMFSIAIVYFLENPIDRYRQKRMTFVKVPEKTRQSKRNTPYKNYPIVP